MGLMLLFLLSQVTYQKEAPIRLNLQPIPFERVTVTRNFILLVDETEQVIHVFGKDGSHRARLGEKDNVFQLPSRASWLDQYKMILIYDGAGRFFSVWNEQGKLVGRKDTEFDMFFNVGNLMAIEGGYIAPVSLTHKKYLLGRFDRDFKMTKNAYEIMDEKLVEMSPVVRQAFSTSLKVNDELVILAAQTLSSDLEFFNPKLESQGTLDIGLDRWRKVNMRKLAKVSKNPRELDELRESFSEIIGVEAVSGSLFVVAYRGLKGSPYSYQCFQAKSRSPVGQTYDNQYMLAGSYGSTLFFKDPNDSVMTLVPCRVQR